MAFLRLDYKVVSSSIHPPPCRKSAREIPFPCQIFAISIRRLHSSSYILVSAYEVGYVVRL
jgi:hypothetical protein